MDDEKDKNDRIQLSDTFDVDFGAVSDDLSDEQKKSLTKTLVDSIVNYFDKTLGEKLVTQPVATPKKKRKTKKTPPVEETTIEESTTKQTSPVEETPIEESTTGPTPTVEEKIETTRYPILWIYNGGVWDSDGGDVAFSFSFRDELTSKFVATAFTSGSDRVYFTVENFTDGTDFDKQQDRVLFLVKTTGPTYSSNMAQLEQEIQDIENSYGTVFFTVIYPAEDESAKPPTFNFTNVMPQFKLTYNSTGITPLPATQDALTIIDQVMSGRNSLFRATKK